MSDEKKERWRMGPTLSHAETCKRTRFMQRHGASGSVNNFLLAYIWSRWEHADTLDEDVVDRMLYNMRSGSSPYVAEIELDAEESDPEEEEEALPPAPNANTTSP